MRQEDFDILAVKVLSGEATAEESARLDELLAQDARKQEEFAELRATWETVKEMGPLAEALHEAPLAPPPKHLNRWRAAIAQQVDAPVSHAILRDEPEVTQSRRSGGWMGGRWPFRWGFAVAMAVILIVAGFVLLRRPSAPPSSPPVAYLMAGQTPVELRRHEDWVAVRDVATLQEIDVVRIRTSGTVTMISAAGVVPMRGPATFSVRQFLADAAARIETSKTNATLPMARSALFDSPPQVLALLVTTRSGGAIPVYSPVGFTANLTPLILWKTEPGKLYHVAIFDELSAATAPLRKANVTSPLAFTNAWPGQTLAGDGLYRLQIAEAGNPVGSSETTFRTLVEAGVASAGDGSDPLLTAYECLVASPPRYGDALAALLSLPEGVAESDLALRLKLLAFGRLGYQDEFHTVVKRLTAGTAR